MTTNENSLPLDGDIRPFDNHASGADIGLEPPAQAPAQPPVVAPGEEPLDHRASGEEIVSLDNHASGPLP
ncbi:hypothetical protein [Streptomyces sp. NPDC031705]|uniref:hypothetical protein n=1 Tax=unclassified Streptomyces TaxID=2593676 RepID=UPI0033DC3A46